MFFLNIVYYVWVVYFNLYFTVMDSIYNEMYPEAQVCIVF